LKPAPQEVKGEKIEKKRREVEESASTELIT
jgi:hypothetical protein